MCLVLFLPRFISLCYLVRDTYGVVKLPSKKACPSLLRHHQIRLKQSKNKKIERFFFPFPLYRETIWWKPRRYLNCLWRFCSHFYGVVKKKPGITWQTLSFLQVSVGEGQARYNKPDVYDKTNMAFGTSAINCAYICYRQTSICTRSFPLWLLSTETFYYDTE